MCTVHTLSQVPSLYLYCFFALYWHPVASFFNKRRKTFYPKPVECIPYLPSNVDGRCGWSLPAPGNKLGGLCTGVAAGDTKGTCTTTSALCNAVSGICACQTGYTPSGLDTCSKLAVHDLAPRNGLTRTVTTLYLIALSLTSLNIVRCYFLRSSILRNSIRL